MATLDHDPLDRVNAAPAETPHTQAGSPRPASARPGRIAVAGHQSHHPDTEVEGRLEVDRRDPTEPGDEPEDRRRRPGRAVEPRSRPGGSTRARLAASPPPVTWPSRGPRPAPIRARQSRRVDPGRLQQFLAERPTEVVHRRGRAPSLRGRRRAYQRVAVGVQARRRHRDGHVACSDPVRPEDPRPRSTTPVAAPAMSYSAGSSSPGCSAVSPPTSAQPAATQASAMPLTMAAIRSGTTLPHAM